MHPNIRNFSSAIQKREITRMKINDFKNWMNNPSKFPEEEREEAQKLLAEAEQLLAGGVGNTGIMQLKSRNEQNVNNKKKHHGNGNNKKPSQQKQTNSNAAAPSSLGAPFHNPYTFISFPAKAPERHAPTPLTIDESDPDRITGIIDLEIETLSPLLVPGIEKVQGEKEPKWCSALKIGKDVIVPASSVRGVLRTLTAIISGSALDYVDDDLWLCQGRDANLDDSTHSVPLYLAEVIKPGSEHSDGIVRFARAQLVESQKLRIIDKDRPGYVRGQKKMWINDPHAQNVFQRDSQTPDHPWRVKVSGRKVGKKDQNFHDGAFKPDEAQTITLRSQLWRDYSGRHRNADHKELRKGDIVWLEPNVVGEQIKDERDVKSIQWARWGRSGTNFRQRLKNSLGYMLPDSIKNDGMVDITSDLFGSIPIPEDGAKASYEAFAARIRPENLVFETPKTFWNEMPPLSSPHPGCKAFYVQNNDLDAISLQDPPKGYKVYRTSKHDPKNAPWLYSTQPVFTSANAPKDFRLAGSMTRKCELVQSGVAGKLKIAFKALNQKELALLLLVLSCDLRIGGGKPLGLGHCIVKNIKVYNEFCEELYAYQPAKAEVPACLEQYVADYKNRASLYCKTQEPVEMMRYPRAIKDFQHGGMCWFSHFATAKKDSQQGMQTYKQIKAQVLPVFDPFDSDADLLFGYDYILSNQPPPRKGENFSQNRESRENARKAR